MLLELLMILDELDICYGAENKVVKSLENVVYKYKNLQGPFLQLRLFKVTQYPTSTTRLNR